MSVFITLPPTINIQSYASMALVDPASFRSDKGHQAPALFIAVGNGIPDTQGVSSCDIYRVDLFSSQVSKITKTPLSFGLVTGLTYNVLTDELLLIDGNQSNGNKVFHINYRTGKVTDYTFFNYGLSAVLEGISRFPTPQEAGFLLLYSNPLKPLSGLNFLNQSEIDSARKNLFYYSYYTEGSRFYQIGNHNDFSFLIFSQVSSFSNILMFKNVKSNLVSVGKPGPLTSDAGSDKYIYRGIGNKIFTLDRVSLRILGQTLLDKGNIVGLAIKDNFFYSLHQNSNQILKTSVSKSHILSHQDVYEEQTRIKPNTSTTIVSEVSDENYNPLTGITVNARILKDKEIDFIETPCNFSVDGNILLEVIPDNLTARDSFFTSTEPLAFNGSDFALVAQPTEDGILTDQTLALELVDIFDNPVTNPIIVEGFFESTLTGTVFDSSVRSMSYWVPERASDILTVNFDTAQTIECIEILLTKENTDPLIIMDQDDNIIYTNSDPIGVLQKITILDFIKTPEVTTTQLKFSAGLGTQIYDISIKVFVTENLGQLNTGTLLSSSGQAQFTYSASGQEGTELIKVSAWNKISNVTQNVTLLDSTVIKSELVNLDIKTKETAASIAINLKNPQTSFSYSTMKFVVPPPPRPVDDLGNVIDYPDIPVLGNANIIDSGSYITSITTSNNQVWVLSQGGNASIISTNPLADALDFIISPSQQPLGAQNVNITITSRLNFTFTSGTSIDFGEGIIVNSIKILEDENGAATKAVANITVSDVTTIGPRTVQIISGSNKVAPLNNRFEVLPQAIAAVSPVNFVAESSTSPRFKTVFINSASLRSSLSLGSFIYIVDDKGYLTRSDSSLNIQKDKIIGGNIKKIDLSSDNKLIIGTEQGAFYWIDGVQDPLTFNPTLNYIASIPKVLVDFVVKEDKIIAINKGLQKLDIIDINTFTRITDSHQISVQDLERIWIKEDRLFVADTAGILYELDFTDFSTINVISTVNSDRITGIEIINNILYIGTEQGKVYSYDTQLTLYQDVSAEGGIVTLSKYFNTLQIGTEYGRYISIMIGS